MNMYILDTNVFIEAKNTFYGFDFCPGFWDWLVAQNENGRVASVRAVAEEIKRGSDDLTVWAQDRRDGFFLPPDRTTLHMFRVIANGAWRSSYTPNAIATFMDNPADLSLIAHALAHGDTVVTRESASSSPNRIKIPDVCGELDVECVQPWVMLRREDARFVLVS